jgi:hypothetical protein
MANTTIPVELSSTPGIVDNSNATAITIDSSGNVLVGQNSSAVPGSGNTVTGISIAGQYDAITISRADAQGLIVNRNTSDGNLVDFNKDGTTVGSISSISGTSASYNSASGLVLLGADQSNYVRAVTSTASGQPRFEPSADGTVDLAQSGSKIQRPLPIRRCSF